MKRVVVVVELAKTLSGGGVSVKIDLAFGFVFGALLAIVGFPPMTWQYWLLFLLAVAWRFWPEQQRKP